MKRSNSKELNIGTVIVVLALAFLCIFNITNSYFTAIATVQKSGLKFSQVNVQFDFTTENTGSQTVNGTQAVALTPMSMVSRGVPFDLEYDGELVEGVGFSLVGESGDVYIRYWIDAYIVGDANRVNYGQHFSLLYDGEEMGYYESKQISEGLNTYENNIYYLLEALSNDSNDAINGKAGTVYEFNQIVLAEDCPDALVGSNVIITLHFDAIQTKNGAYLVEFDDERGYNVDWEIVE